MALNDMMANETAEMGGVPPEVQSSVPPIDETRAIPEVMNQFRERLFALPPEAVSEMLLELASAYMDADEMEQALSEAEAQYAEEPVPEEEVPEELPTPREGERGQEVTTT